MRKREATSPPRSGYPFSRPPRHEGGAHMPDDRCRLGSDDVVIGLDLASAEHQVVVLTAAGQRLTRFRIPHSIVRHMGPSFVSGWTREGITRTRRRCRFPLSHTLKCEVLATSTAEIVFYNPVSPEQFVVGHFAFDIGIVKNIGGPLITFVTDY